MKRLAVVAIAALAVVFAFGVARRIVWVNVLRLQERMMQNVMPRMMDLCFSRMPAERRELMLAHCRGQLDRVEAKYQRGEAPAPAPGRADVA